MKRIVPFSMLLVIIVMAATVHGGDCPRFRGPACDGKFPETGLLKKWPDGGPKLTWSVKELGKGYSSAVVVDGTVYVTGMDDQKQGYLFAFGLDGSPKWKTTYGPEMDRTGPAVAGTRGTPTVDGDRIFLMSSFGKLITIDPAKGKVLKSVDLLERFGAEQARFGFAECVLVDGQKVICTPGGPDASLVALDKSTGETVWQTKSLSEPSGYCAARLIRHGGRRLLVTMVAKGVVAVDPDTGNVLWQHEHPHRAAVHPNPPLYEDGMVYICSGMKAGGQMLTLADDGLSATPKWSDKTLDCQMHGMVVVDGYIYGTAQSSPSMVCLELKTGKVMWTAKETGRGAVVCADGMLYVYSEKGEMHLVRANPKAFESVSSFQIGEGTDEHWAHPTIANGRLYVRHGDALMAYDIKAGF
ncbi:MAG: PQQ-binding-like beta-propeller repeat protein [Planctomycetota bacterium]